MTYRPKYFSLQELVAPAIYRARGEAAWELLQAPALVTLDQLREYFGPLTINNWHSGGPFKESGLREFNTSTGAAWSQHKYGGAFDGKPTKVSVVEMYDAILSHRDKFPHLTVLENIKATPTWIHFDVRNHNRDGIWIVNP